MPKVLQSLTSRNLLPENNVLFCFISSILFGVFSVMNVSDPAVRAGVNDDIFVQ